MNLMYSKFNNQNFFSEKFIPLFLNSRLKRRKVWFLQPSILWWECLAELPLDHLAPDPDRVQDLGVDRVLAKDRNTVVVDVQDQEIEDDHGQEIDADQDHEKEEDDQEQDLENEEEIAAVPDHEIGMLHILLVFQ